MSWQATAFIKHLKTHGDGTPLSAREKLILFVLADSHNEDAGCCWLGITNASAAALTSRSRFIELTGRMERLGTIKIERREGKSSRYFINGLPVQKSDPYPQKPVRKSDGTRPILAPDPSDSCRTQVVSIEPIRVDIPAASAPDVSFPDESKIERALRKHEEAKARFAKQYPRLAAR